MRRFAILLIVLALAVRLAVPTGWMPGEKSFQLTLCAGVDTQTVWMDSKGGLHKEDPAKGKSVEHSPCAFAGMALATDLPTGNFGMSLPHIASAEPPRSVWTVSVGNGLAAPPPPAIGPPAFI